MSAPTKPSKDAVSVHFPGTIAAQKRLQSAGMVVHGIELYRNQIGQAWEADTDRGKRWVVFDLKTGWKISKEPPAAKRKARRLAPCCG